MAIVWGEYGLYDDATGAPVFNAGGESGFNWMTAGNETVPSVPAGMSPSLWETISNAMSSGGSTATNALKTLFGGAGAALTWTEDI